MASLRALTSKLQTALMLQGRKITINQFQAYSEKQKRMVTKFVCNEKNQAGKYKMIFSSWQLADVVQFLANELNGGGDG